VASKTGGNTVEHRKNLDMKEHAVDERGERQIPEAIGQSSEHKQKILIHEEGIGKARTD
jgi:hypothetical protein